VFYRFQNERFMSRSILISVATVLCMPIVFFCAPSADNLIKKASDIHQQILTLDSHTDTPIILQREEFDIGIRNEPAQGRIQVDFPRMREGGLDAVFFAVFLRQGERSPEGFEVAREKAEGIFNLIYQTIEKYSNLAELALKPDDAYRLREKKKFAIYIGLENGYPIGLDLTYIEKYYSLGARYITLSHGLNNDICDSSTDPSGAEHNGLSSFGREVIKEMNRLGMMIDVSHISDQAFYDVLEITRIPVVATHSNAKAISNHPRNMDDNMLMALKDNGGVIQLCVLSSYVKTPVANPERDSAIKDLREKYNNFQELSDKEMERVNKERDKINEKYPVKLATVADLVDHVDHIVELIGIDYLGIGTDFDGGGGLEDCRDVSEIGNITLELVRRGYTQEEIEKIWSGNFMRVFRENQKASGL
jgi:membrane dipeptidase